MLPDGKPVPGSVYFYAPVKWAPIIFSVCFFVSTTYHIWQCYRHKAFRMTGLYPFCGLLFTVGFSIRSYDAFDYTNISTYIASTTFIYCAPPILELANYHILGRILYYVPYFSPLHPGRTLTTFGTISGLVEILNALGVSYLANPAIPQNYKDLGHILMKTSLIMQICVISLFCVIAATFHRRCLRGGITTRKVQGPLLTLYLSMALILLRTIYRVVEHFGTSSIPTTPEPDWDPMTLSPIIRYEWFFWVFEACPMVVNMVLWNARHPHRYLPQDYHVYLKQDGKSEVLGPGWKDDVPWWMTFIDPCGLSARMRGKATKKPFWDTDEWETIPDV